MKAKLPPISPSERLNRAHKRAKALRQAIVRLNHDLAHIGGIAGLDDSAIKSVQRDLNRKLLG